MTPVSVSEDRTLTVPPGALVKTAYVRVEDVVLACRERMAVGDVERAYRRRLQLGEDQAWPPPVGHPRDDGRFVIEDGRHDYVACLMLGMSHLLVAWIER